MLIQLHKKQIVQQSIHELLTCSLTAIVYSCIGHLFIRCNNQCPNWSPGHQVQQSICVLVTCPLGAIIYSYIGHLYVSAIVYSRIGNLVIRCNSLFMFLSHGHQVQQSICVLVTCSLGAIVQLCTGHLIIRCNNLCMYWSPALQMQ